MQKMSAILLHAEALPVGLQRHAQAALHDEPPSSHHVDTRTSTLDDAFLAYLLRVRAPFDLLRDSLAQAAALLVLIASSRREAGVHPMQAVVEANAQEVREALGTLKLPNTARHGHAHLLASLAALDCASRTMHAPYAAYDALQRGLRELRFAAGNLPGLEILSGAESCACHARTREAE
jgi:hypothetical protein